MKIDSIIEITARLSDAQELIERGRTQDAVALLDDTKRELFFKAHDDDASGLPFPAWCKANGIFVNFDKPGDNDHHTHTSDNVSDENPTDRPGQTNDDPGRIE